MREALAARDALGAEKTLDAHEMLGESETLDESKAPDAHKPGLVFEDGPLPAGLQEVHVDPIAGELDSVG